MNVRIIVSYLADFLAVILMIIQMVRIRKLTGQKDSVRRYFRRFSVMVLVMSVLHLIKSYSDMELGIYTMEDFQRLTAADQSAWLWTEVSAGIVEIFLTTVFIYMWITFLSLYLFEDRDFIRRRFWFGFAPLMIAAVVSGFSVPMAIQSEQGYWFFVAVIILFFIVRICYFLVGFWLLHEYKKQNGYLRFFNPWVFFIPVFAGWILQDVFYWGFSALGSTLGVMLLYESIMSEQKYKDRETGFYNMDAVTYLKDLADKGKYEAFSAMSFSFDTPGRLPSFSEILRQQLPNNCEPIVHNDREIVVLTSVHERGPLFMVVEDVKAVSDVNAGCILKKKSETTQKFMERVLL